MGEERGRWLRHRAGVIALWLVLPLVLGVLLSLSVPQPIVGVIYLDDAIFSVTARDLIAQIDYARENPKVRVVLLVLDSPGGTVADTESVYLELARLRRTKPVVTIVRGMAASGAYYLAVGTDYILASPSSAVGNVGVIGQLPSPPAVFEDLASTGPYKMWGAPRDTFLRQMEMIKQGFYEAVQLGRGDALRIGPDVLLRGEIWPGSEALRLGLVDEIGSQSLAVEQAARMAKIAHYRVADLRQLAGLPAASPFPFFFETREGVVTPYPREPGLYLLYVPPSERRSP
jgi:protease-4